MQKAIAYLFLPLYLTILLRPFAPYVSYSLHQAYFAEVLCENKEVPEMQCNGACHLKKQIKETQTEHNSNAPVRIMMEESPAYLQTEAIELFFPELSIEYPIQSDIIRAPHVSHFIWKPPQTLV